jgi:hypothetical protein
MRSLTSGRSLASDTVKGCTMPALSAGGVHTVKGCTMPALSAGGVHGHDRVGRAGVGQASREETGVVRGGQGGLQGAMGI